MSFSPQRSRAGNAFAAGSVQQSGDVQTGSVSAARERLRAVQAVRAQASMSQQSPNSIDSLLSPRSPTSPNSSRRPWEAPTYSPTSRERTYAQDYNYQPPAPESAWPLPASRYNPGANTTSSKSKNRNSMQIATPTSPQTFYDASPQELSPQSLQPPQPAYGRSRDGYSPSDYSDVSAPAPSIPRRITSTSSTGSGSIPDFPLPTSQYQSGRRSQSFSQQGGRSRRGPSSYYSQMSGPFGVSPIPEESNSRTTNSYASSNVIPAAQMKDFYLEETPSDDDLSSMEFDWQTDGEKIEGNQLVRQASVGRRQKPALTTIRSGENLRAPVGIPSMPTQVPGARITRMSQVASILDGESVLLDASSSEHTRDQDGRSVVGAEYSDPFNLNPGALGRLGSLRKGDRGSVAEQGQSRNATLADRIGSRRPPNLDVQAVREAEARASLTSLPDLIRRATRLAANLDKGRTASRLGVDWMLSDEGKPRTGFARRPSEGSSLSGMLRSFPPPAAMIRGQTPSDSATADELYKNLNIKKSKDSPGNRNRQNQICGFSRKAFYSILIIVFFLIVAAVILPVFLIVLPRKNATSSSTSVPVESALANCQKTNPCSNGGTVVINLDQSCGCICTNGFTGSQCKTQSNAGCTNIAASGTKSASVGTQIPALIQAAEQKFSIPLDATQLSSTFASNNMTCTTENAIVTFSEPTNKKREQVSELEVAIQNAGSISKTEFLYPRGLLFDGQSSVTLVPWTSSTAAVTAATATTTGTGTGTNTAGAGSGSGSGTGSTSTSTSASAPIQTGSASPVTNSTAMEFAEVGVLFVLQDSRDLAIAVGAQDNLSQFFSSAAKTGTSMQAASNITLGSGYFINLWYFTVTLRNNTEYGVGVNFNGTATGFSS